MPALGGGRGPTGQEYRVRLLLGVVAKISQVTESLVVRYPGFLSRSPLNSSFFFDLTGPPPPAMSVPPSSTAPRTTQSQRAGPGQTPMSSPAVTPQTATPRSGSAAGGPNPLTGGPNPAGGSNPRQEQRLQQVARWCCNLCRRWWTKQFSPRYRHWCRRWRGGWQPRRGRSPTHAPVSEA